MSLKIPAEDQGWRILKHEPGPFGSTQAEQLVGLLLVYVDDLLILGGSSDVSAIKVIRENGNIDL